MSRICHAPACAPCPLEASARRVLELLKQDLRDDPQCSYPDCENECPCLCEDALAIKDLEDALGRE